MRAILVVAVLTACGDDAVTVAPEHDPLGSTDDILPYPSSLYEIADMTSPTGVRLDVPVGAFPGNADTGVPFDPAPLARRHGWSPLTTMLWAAPHGVDPAGLVGYGDLGASITDASTTVIVDMMTGLRVA